MRIGLVTRVAKMQRAGIRLDILGHLSRLLIKPEGEASTNLEEGAGKR